MILPTSDPRSASSLPSLPPLSDISDDLPTFCGWEANLPTAAPRSALFRSQTRFDPETVKSVFAIALHMHQPIVPAGPNGELISYLQHMLENPFEGQNFNAGVFTYCYTRIADFLTAIVQGGGHPRIMLDYSGTLLWGLRHMGRGEILENLKRITCNPTYQRHVEWMGTLWSHALVPTIPVADFRLQVQAWQHHFAAIFGWDALMRVQGFSLPELQLPTHPDVLYEFITTLLSCGYRWMLVAESSLETLAGDPLPSTQLPHRLVARNSQGAIASIVVFIRPSNQTSTDVARMTAYEQATQVSDRLALNGASVPPIITHIADGENGDAMMNEFPSAFRNTWYNLNSQQGRVVSMTFSEYLEHLEALGCTIDQLPPCQAAGHAQLWKIVDTQNISNPADAIAQSLHSSPGLSLTGNTGKTLYPPQPPSSHPYLMSQLSTRFHATIAQAEAQPEAPPLRQQYRYRNALLHHLLTQTSCFMRWQDPTWHAYARELYRRGEAILRHDF